MSPMSWTCGVCGTITSDPSRRCPDHPPRSNSAQQRFRTAVLLRDNHRCRRCGTNQDLVAAHWPVPLRSFGTDPAAYKPESGICLCRACHRKLDRYAS